MEQSSNFYKKYIKKVNSDIKYLKRYKELIKAFIEINGDIEGKQRELLGKRIEEWKLCPYEAEYVEEELKKDLDEVIKEKKKLKEEEKKKREQLIKIKNRIEEEKDKKKKEELQREEERKKEEKKFRKKEDDGKRKIERNVRNNKSFALNFGKYEEAEDIKIEELFKVASEVCCNTDSILINLESAHAWTQRGIILERLGKYEEAIKCYDKALKIDSEVCCDTDSILINLESVYAWTQRGIILERLGKYEEAIKCYDKALEIDSKYTPALINKKYALELLQR